MVVYSCHSSYGRKYKIGGCQLRRKSETVSKIREAKSTEDETQGLEHLASKHKALSSDSCTTKQQQQKDEK
jgi:hypothetical protein